MRKLILIKHARPEVVPGEPASGWGLSAEGRASCELLATKLAAYGPEVIVTSEEPKAVETGEIVGARLGRAVRAAEGLHEHERDNVPHMASREFISFMAMVFQKREQRVLGEESAGEALRRFTAAVEKVMAENEGNVAIVTHGTVLALFVAESSGENAFQLWRKLQLPSMVIVEWPGRGVVEVVERVG